MASPLFLLSHLPEPEPSPTLLTKTLAAIFEAQSRALRSKLLLTSLGLVASIAYGAWSLPFFLVELRTSAFFGFFQLVLSDPDIMLSHLKELLLAFLETLPLDTLLLGSLAGLCLLGSFYVMSALRHLRSYHHLSS